MPYCCNVSAMAMSGFTNFVCLVCGKSDYSSGSLLKQHILSEHVVFDDDILNSCPLCDKNCCSLDAMDLHLDLEHAVIFSPEMTQSQIMDEILTYTPDTSLIMALDLNFTDNESEKCKVNKHTQTCDSTSNNHVSTLYDCPLCDYETTSEVEIQYHVDTSHFECEVVVAIDEIENKSAETNYCRNPTSFYKELKNDKFETSLLNDSLLTSVSYGETLENGGSYNFPCTDAQLRPSIQEQNSQRDDVKIKLYNCPFCGNSYDSLASVQLHIERSHPDVYSGNKDAPHNVCPMCGKSFSDSVSMSEHVNQHFESDCSSGAESLKTDGAVDSKAPTPMDGGADTGSHSYKSQMERNLSRSVVKGDMTVDQYYQQKTLLYQENVHGIDDGHSCTKGIIGRLKEFYQFLPSNISMVGLCTYSDHYASSYGDRGWGCGYRNLQMLLSCLATEDMYRHVLFNGCALIPSIPKIQRLIETAWQKGFDKLGAKQLNGCLVNTSKWIGATDVMATLQSLRAKCKLVDFHAPSAPDGTHPKLFQWVKEYFTHPNLQFIPPLILQHQGHSRTIVGIEEMADGSTRLLLFDPATKKSDMEKLKRKICTESLKILRRGISSFKAKQYQVLAVVGIIDSSDYHLFKVLKSERF